MRFKRVETAAESPKKAVQSFCALCNDCIEKTRLDLSVVGLGGLPPLRAKDARWMGRPILSIASHSSRGGNDGGELKKLAVERLGRCYCPDPPLMIW
jgi:hypothetical protein